MNSIIYGNALRDYVRIIFKRKTIIIATFLTVIVGVLLGLEIQTPVYESKVKMLISGEKQVESPYYKLIDESKPLNEGEFIKTNMVLERVVTALKLDDRPLDYEKKFCSPIKIYLIDLRKKISELIEKPKDITPEQEKDIRFRIAVGSLKGAIDVEEIKGTDLFSIGVKDFDPKEAATIANVVSRSYLIFNLEQQMAEHQLQYGEKYPLVAQLKDYIDRINKNLTQKKLPSLEAMGPSTVKIIEQAYVPDLPTGKSPSLLILLAVFMGLFLGLMLAFGLEFIDPTFKSTQDVETFLNLPLLGSIPKKDFKNMILIKDTKRSNIHHSPYQNISDQIYLLMKDKNLKSILITAASPMEGSTTIIANLANYLSNVSGHKTIIIDANLRSPSIHKIFRIFDNPGLANILEGRVSMQETIQDLSPNLAVLPAGNTLLNPTPLLDSTRMANVIKSAKEKYELIFLDYANLRSFKDACVLCQYLDGIILVVNEGRTRHHVMQSLISPLKYKKANFVGVILNNRTFSIPKMIYDRL